MKLVFVHIEEHLQLHNISIPLTSEFNFHLKEGELLISKNDQYIESFYEGINIKAIIGKNGSGKTSILDFIESLYSNIESSGAFLFFDKNSKTFFQKTLNTKSFNFRLCGKIKDHKINHLESRHLHKIIKVNNLSSFSANKNASKKNVVNLSSEKLSSSKKNRTKQLENIFSYLKRKGNKYSSNVVYTFKFRGMTPALKNWIKESFVCYLIKEGYFKNNESFYSSYLRESQSDVKDGHNVLKSLFLAKEPSELPIEFENLISDFSNYYLRTILSDISNNDRLSYLLPLDVTLPDHSVGAIVSKGILNIFRNNILKHKVDGNLSAYLCINLIGKLINNRELLNRNVWDSDFYIEEILASAIEQVLKNNSNNRNGSPSQLYESLNGLQHDLRMDLDIFLEVIRNITSTKSGEIVNNNPSVTLYKKNYWLEELISNTEGYPALNSSTVFEGYSGIEQIKYSTPLDIAYISEEVTKLPLYLQKSIDHGWEGLSSGEFAKTSLFSSIFNFLLRESPYNFQLFLIDEADLYLHPEWQRKFVFDLIELIKNLNCESTSQFIITTHSPLIIGDFLPEDILALNVEDGKPVACSSLGFGTVLSDFYLEGMHLDSTYGEHSRIKLQEMIDAKLKNIALTKEQIKLVNKICNKALKEALLDG
ncbi:AAA family ATPase [Pseudoalteromonas sp.]|uniref:AAA family ATPase n=1 Tax=Pseudoalteromonas sp. TaxID=53249 RepID=UPI003001AEEB